MKLICSPEEFSPIVSESDFLRRISEVVAEHELDLVNSRIGSFRIAAITTQYCFEFKKPKIATFIKVELIIGCGRYINNIDKLLGWLPHRNVQDFSDRFHRSYLKKHQDQCDEYAEKIRNIGKDIKDDNATTSRKEDQIEMSQEYLSTEMICPRCGGAVFENDNSLICENAFQVCDFFLCPYLRYQFRWAEVEALVAGKNIWIDRWNNAGKYVGHFGYLAEMRSPRSYKRLWVIEFEDRKNYLRTEGKKS